MARRSGERLLKMPNGKTVENTDANLAEAKKQTDEKQAKATKAAAKQTAEK